MSKSAQDCAVFQAIREREEGQKMARDIIWGVIIVAVMALSALGYFVLLAP